MATIAECAKHIDMAPDRFEELVKTGVIEKSAGGAFDLDAVRAAYLNHLRARSSGGADRSALEQEKAADEARLAKAKADKAELLAQEMRGELLPADDFASGLFNVVTLVKTNLNAIPYRTAPIVNGASSIASAEKVMRTEINEAMKPLLLFEPAKALE